MIPSTVGSKVAASACRISMHWLGTALIEIYEADAEDPTKTDLLDQVVSIMRCCKDRQERVKEIENLMRGWQQMRRG
jgi:hypothetical protein